MSEPERILIVRLSHLGDVVCALGLFHALHEAYPGAEIAWVVQPEFAGLLEGLPGLARIFRFRRDGGWRAWPELAGQLRGFAPDLVVDAQGNLKSAAVTLSSGSRRRVGLARREWRERLGSLAVNERAPASPPDALHAVDRVRSLVRHVAPAASSPLRFDVGLSADEHDRGAAELEARAPYGKGAIALHLSSVEDVRAWPLERWVQLVDALRAAHVPCLVVSGPDEAREGEAIARRFPAADGVSHWVGQRGLRELAAVFSAAAERGWRLVSCDSGPMHLAWTVGLGVLVLEGPQSARRTGPWPADGRGPHAAVTSGAPPDCAPCLARRCRHPDGPVCMGSIEAADVLAAVLARR